MNVKKCHVEPTPEPPLPAACTLQRFQQKEKAGVIFCPKAPIEPPQPAPSCEALCFEKIKNPPVPPQPDFPIVCIVNRTLTTNDRCDDILEKAAAHPDLPWPGCPPPPLPPPPPEHDLCEELAIKAKKAECNERKKRYLE